MSNPETIREGMTTNEATDIGYHESHSGEIVTSYGKSTGFVSDAGTVRPTK